jgi:hypothetical protein
MTKYVISHDGCVLAVASNRADAEEYVLSWVEEHAYYEYAYTGFDNAYIDVLLEDFSYDIFKTFWGFILFSCGEEFYIDEVEEI